MKHAIFLLFAAGCADKGDTGGAEADDTAETDDTGGEATLPDTTDGCPEETFLDVSAYEGPGEGYPDPWLEVSCSDGELRVQSNDIPHYEFVQVSPFDLQEQDLDLSIPLEPTWSEEPYAYSINSVIGVAINGTYLSAPSESGFLQYGDPVYDNALDVCLGHTGPESNYHDHALVSACYFDGDDGSSASPLIAWAYDGYGVYGPYDCLDADCAEIAEMLSSYEQINDPGDCSADSYAYAGDAEGEAEDGDAYLDECNGHFGPAGDYHYHATEGYPYTVGCYHGVPSGEASLWGNPSTAEYEELCVDGAYTGE